MLSHLLVNEERGHERSNVPLELRIEAVSSNPLAVGDLWTKQSLVIVDTDRSKKNQGQFSDATIKEKSP